MNVLPPRWGCAPATTVASRTESFLQSGSTHPCSAIAQKDEEANQASTGSCWSVYRMSDVSKSHSYISLFLKKVHSHVSLRPAYGNTFSEFDIDNWSSQWPSRESGNLNFCGQSSNLHGKSRLDYINSILRTNDIHDVSARTVSEKVTF